MKGSLRPAPGEVHIHLFNLARNADELGRLRQLLTGKETERADRLIDPQIRNRFITCRALLRETLATCLGQPPGRIALAYSIHGKPFLPLTNPDSRRLCFNLSHSGDMAVVALADHCEVGIDLERLCQDLPYRAMASRFFSRREQSELFSLPAELQPAAFYRCWTRKEAYLKGNGSGFSMPADTFDVSLLPGHPPALLEHRTNLAEPARWSLSDLELGESIFAALAVNGPLPSIHLLS